MSEEKKQTPVEPHDEEKGATFDMYHFFSRKDVILAALVILGLLLYVLYWFLSRAPVA